MPSDKARLYLALYVRGGPAKRADKADRYHWAFLIGSKSDGDSSGKRYHAKNPPGKSIWVFEEKSTSMTATNMILVRILIGKINNEDAVAVELRQVAVENGKPDWTCVDWIEEALMTLIEEDKKRGKDKKLMGTSQLDWKTVKSAAMQYCERKVSEGRFRGEGNFDMSKVPTFDLLQLKETVK